MHGMPVQKTAAASPQNLMLEGIRVIVRAAGGLVARLGTRYQCPLCHVRLKRFLPFGQRLSILRDLEVVGGGYRENAQCPACGCIDRERLLFLYLLHQTDLLDRPARLLHVAPEARVSEFLHAQSNLDYVTADLSGERVMVAMDITKIQFAHDSFDAIICNHVLEHIVDDSKAMAELFRVLRPGGWAIVQVPISFRLRQSIEDSSITSAAGREAAFGQADHVRIYGQDYFARLMRAGFDVETICWISRRDVFGGRRNRFGLNPDERVFVARKPGSPKSTLTPPSAHPPA